jgi:hypothetical protein
MRLTKAKHHMIRISALHFMLKRNVFLSLASCALVLTAACRDKGAELQQKLVKTVKQGPGTVIDMRELTPFEWDRMYVIQPYTPPEAINRQLGFEWAEAKTSDIQMFDTIILLVFVKGKEVVADVEYKIRDGYFRAGGKNEFSVEEARFVVEQDPENGNVPIIKYSP